MKRPLFLAFFLVMNACGTSSSASAVDAGVRDAGSFDAGPTTLDCPNPGPLPFALQSHGFLNAADVGADYDGGFVKDEATDAIGNPDAGSVNVFAAEDAGPAPGIAAYQGRKARAPITEGIDTTPLVGEYVSLWYYDASAARWTTIGRTTTDVQGNYTIAATLAPALDAAVYAVLEADGTCATHYDDLLPPGSKVVVADIDGTLTTDDGQLITELGDETYMPAMMKDANGMMQAWAAKKYPLVYLTARSHVFRAETRLWLDNLSFPTGVVVTAPALESGASAEAYKSAWLTRMVKDFGWDVVAAYGNEDSDIEAYQSVAISNDRIFIVGPSGGDLGSTAIPDNDFTSHVTGFVDAQPEND